MVVLGEIVAINIHCRRVKQLVTDIIASMTHISNNITQSQPVVCISYRGGNDSLLVAII